MFFREEVKVCLAQSLCRILKAKGFCMSLADPDKMAVGIFEIDVIRNVIHERTQQIPFKGQPLKK